MPKKHYLITGATGFLGRHLLSCSQDADIQWTVLIRNPDLWQHYDWTREFANVDFITYRLEDESFGEITRSLPHCDGLFHLAAVVDHSRENIKKTYKVNVEGTSHLVKLAAHYQCRMVMVSTSGVVGCARGDNAHADEQSEYALSIIRDWPYYHSKYMAEKLSFDLAKTLGVELCVVRAPVLLGPGDHRHRSSQHVNRVLRSRFPIVINGGMHFTDVRDCAAAIMQIMRHPKPRAIYHLPGAQMSLRQFYGMVAGLAEREQLLCVLPYHLAKGLAIIFAYCRRKKIFSMFHHFPDPVLVEMARHYWNCQSLYAKTDLQYLPRRCEITLRDTIEWLEQEKSAQTECPHQPQWH